MANAFNELSGVLRTSTGKGPSRRLRQANLLPAIVYGGPKGAVAVAVSPKEATRSLQSPLRRNVMIHLNLQDEKGQNPHTKTVMVRDLQIDPVRRNLTHIDFVEIDAKAPVAVNVPLLLTGKSKSVIAGGKLDQIKHTIRVKVLPSDIPEKLELDVTELPFGSTPASAVMLPQGITLVDAPITAVVTIKIPRAEKEEEGAAASGAPAAAPAAS